jgi:hypothetical protein
MAMHYIMEEVFIGNQNIETENLLLLLRTFSYYLETDQIDQNSSILSQIFNEFVNSRTEPINTQICYILKWSCCYKSHENQDKENVVFYELSFEPQQIDTLCQESKKTSVRKATEHLPTYKKIRADDPLLQNNDPCSICFDAYEVGQYKRELSKCQHVFHKKCIDKWFVSHPNLECPMCRTNYNK